MLKLSKLAASLVAGALISLPAVSDAFVDWQFRRQLPEQAGYSKRDRDGLASLIESSSPRTVYVWRDRKAAATAYVWNLTPESLDGAADIFGGRR